jgi:hypothetical protein
MNDDVYEAISMAMSESLVKTPVIGESGSDPSPFMPEPHGLKRVLREPIPIKAAWLKVFTKEFFGLVITQQAVQHETPSSTDTVIPVRELFKCKLNKHGMVDKLKCRIVFRGDLYDPQDPLDSWNPHASWFSLRMFCAMCAKYNIFPSQTDFVMAYLQVKMNK